LRLTKFGLSCLVLGASFCLAQTTQPQPPEQPTRDQQGASSSAQQPANSAAPAQAQPEDKRGSTDKDSPKKDTPTGDKGTSNDRIFFALPNYLTLENGRQVQPLTSGQKFKLVAHGAFDYTQIPWYAALGAISQADNNEPGYGQGWQGYGKRVASAFGDGTIENFMTGAVLPSMFHQDPRYFQMGKGTFLHRATYSASRILITRSDSGRREFNFSEVFGSAISAGISTYSYHPRADRTLSNTATVWGTQLAFDSMTIVLREFWPDIHRLITKKRAN